MGVYNNCLEAIEVLAIWETMDGPSELCRVCCGCTYMYLYGAIILEFLNSCI